MKLCFDFMPAYLQEIVKKTTDVFQIDSDYPLTALFSAVAASLGDRYLIIDPKGYRNAVASWLCQIGPSGYGKSECASFFMEPLLDRDEARHTAYLKEKAKWLKEDPKEKGECPMEKKLVVNDCTPEALFDAMEKAGTDGIILYRDELSGWLKDIGRYGNSGEVEQYLTAWSQKHVSVARLGREDNFIKRPCFNVFGGIQPEILRTMFGKENLIDNGFNARFLFVYADDSISLSYFKESIPDSMRVAYKALVDRLLNIRKSEIRFSSAAEESFIKYWEDLQLRKTTRDLMRKRLFAKLQIYVEKWAGIIEILASDGTPSIEISANSMDIAISHMKVFEEWALAVYSIINPDFTVHGADLLPHLNKAETLLQLQRHFPKMNKSMVAEGLGINRSALSRRPNEAGTPERNTKISLIN